MYQPSDWRRENVVSVLWCCYQWLDRVSRRHFSRTCFSARRARVCTRLVCWRASVCLSALRSRRIWLWLRLSLPARKSTGASSRDNRYPESLADTSMLTGTHRGTLVATATHPLWALFHLCHMNNWTLRGVGVETLLFHVARRLVFTSDCVCSLPCRGDSPTAASLNLQPASRLTALPTSHYKLHTRDAGGAPPPQSVIVILEAFSNRSTRSPGWIRRFFLKKDLFALYIFYIADMIKPFYSLEWILNKLF